MARIFTPRSGQGKWKKLLNPYTIEEISNSIRCSSYINYEYFINAVSEISDLSYRQIENKKLNTIKLSISRSSLVNMQFLLEKVFNKIEFDCIDEKKFWNHDLYLFWGAKIVKNDELYKEVLQKKCDYQFIEDGFIRSVVGGLVSNADKKYSIGHSFIFDKLCPYYDGNHLNQLDILIENAKSLSVHRRNALRKFIDLIIVNNISKYNHQPSFSTLSIGENKDKVLIVLQSYGDASVNIIGGDESAFEEILQFVIKQYPNSDILIKGHPDTFIKKNKSYLEFYNKPNIYFIDFPINPLTLLKYVSDVHVFSSFMGFEALMLDKKVFVHGKAFYAGRGLTYDFCKFPHRKKNIELLELVNVLYFKYCHFYDPNSGKRVSPLKTIDNIIRLRDNYFREIYTSKNILYIKLDGIGDYVLSRNCIVNLKKSEYFKDANISILCDDSTQDVVNFYDANFYEDLHFIKRRNNRLLGQILNLRLKFSKNKIVRCLLELYIKYLLRKVPKNKYDCIIVSCWNNKLQIVVNEIVRQFTAKLKIARSCFGQIEGHNEIYNLQIPISGDHYKIFRKYLEKIFIENIIGTSVENINYNKTINNKMNHVVIFASAHAQKRRWKIYNFISVAQYIVNRYGLKVYIYTDKYGKQFKNAINSPLIEYKICEKAHTIIENIQKASLCISNDTGYYHIAVSHNTPVIVISNGNSLYTFLKYPKNVNNYYIFPDCIDKWIKEKNESELKRITRSSSLDINDITVKKVINCVEQVLEQQIREICYEN